jgi:hypothetical protein
MAEFPLRLPTESTIGKDGQESNARLVNAYIESMGQDSGGKVAFTTYAAPGLARWSQSSFINSGRGMILLDDETLIAVLGTAVVQFDTEGASTVLSGLIGADRLCMARNMNGTPQIGIVNSAGSYYTLISGTLTDRTATETNLVDPNSVCYVGGYFVFGTNEGKIVHTPPIDTATGITATAYGWSSSTSDAIVRVYAHAGFLYVFKSKSTEIWANAGTVPFAFQVLQQFFPLGLMAKFSIAETEDGILWVDQNGTVRMGNDGSSQRVSTSTVERAVESLSAEDKADMTGSIIYWEGHKCYQLRSSGFTWVYDIAMKRWFQRNSGAFPYWFVNDSICFNGKYICSSSENGLLYQLSPGVYNDNGQEFTVELWCPNSHNFPNAFLADSLDVDCITGVALSSGAGSDIDPVLMIDYSDDGGRHFRGERQVKLGKIGDTNRFVRTNGLGRVNSKGRIWRFRASASILRGVMQAHLSGRRANT